MERLGQGEIDKQIIRILFIEIRIYIIITI